MMTYLYEINKDFRKEILSLGDRIHALERIEKTYKLMQETLLTSEEKFAVCFLKSPIPQAISSITDGRYIDVNDAFAAVMGSTREELIGQTSIGTGVITVEQRGTFLNEYRDKGVVESLEIQTRLKDGEFRHGLLNATKIIINNEDYFLTTFTDITERKRLEDILNKSEALRKRTFETSCIPIIVLDYETGKCVDCNPAAVKIYRCTSREDILGKTVSDVSPPRQYDSTPSAEKSRFYSEKAIAEGMCVFEWLHQGRDGELWDGLVHLMSFQSDGRQFLQFTLQDITEKKHIEDAFMKSEEKFRKAFYTSPDAVNISRMQDGMYVSINPAFTEITGYTEAEIINKTSIECNIWVDTADREKLLCELRKASIVKSFEAPFRMKNGDIRYGSMSASVIELEGVPHLLNIMRDITNEKFAREALQESEARFRAVFEGANDAIIISSGTGIMYDCNNRALQMFGCKSIDELFTKYESDFWPPFQPDGSKSSARAFELVAETRQNGHCRFEWVHRRMNREEFYTEVHLSTFNYGGLPAIRATIRDITERKEMEDILKKTLDDSELRVKERTIELEETNTALRVLLKNRDNDRKVLEESLQANIDQLVVPYISKLKIVESDMRSEYLNVLETNLKNITSPFINKISTTYKNLSPRELEICSLIKDGKSSKEIAELLCISVGTVNTYRNNIRDKMGIVSIDINLRSFLFSLNNV